MNLLIKFLTRYYWIETLKVSSEIFLKTLKDSSSPAKYGSDQIWRTLEIKNSNLQKNPKFYRDRRWSPETLARVRPTPTTASQNAYDVGVGVGAVARVGVRPCVTNRPPTLLPKKVDRWIFFSWARVFEQRLRHKMRSTTTTTMTTIASASASADPKIFQVYDRAALSQQHQSLSDRLKTRTVSL